MSSILEVKCLKKNCPDAPKVYTTLKYFAKGMEIYMIL